MKYDILNMKSIIKLLNKRFLGMTSVGFQVLWRHRGQDMDESAVKQALASFVRLVLKHEPLREGRWCAGQQWVFVKLESLVQKVMKEYKVEKDNWVTVIEEEERDWLWGDPRCYPTSPIDSSTPLILYIGPLD
jgi:hypothetical protein